MEFIFNEIFSISIIILIYILSKIMNEIAKTNKKLSEISLQIEEFNRKNSQLLEMIESIEHQTTKHFIINSAELKVSQIEVSNLKSKLQEEKNKNQRQNLSSITNRRHWIP